MLKFFTVLFILFLSATISDGVPFTKRCPNDYSCDIAENLIFTIRCVEPCTIETGSRILTLPDPTGTPELSSIQSIIVKGRLRNLPTNLCLYRRTIRILYLSANAIQDSLSSEYFSCLEQIETIILSHNHIKTINPNTFDALKKLKTLDLSFNLISSLPPKLFVLQLPSLQTLYLNSNTLTEIDVWFFYLESINWIDLSNNSISKFSNLIGWTPRSTDMLPSPSLRGSSSIINLRFNKLTKFDDDLLNEYRICNSADLGYFLKLMSTANLTENSFSCTCDSYNLLMFYQTLTNENSITPSESLTAKTKCSSPAQEVSKSIFNFKDPDECVGISKYPPVVYQTCVSKPVEPTNPEALVNPNDALNITIPNPGVNRTLTSAQIAGIVIGFLGLFFLILALFYCLCPIEILACLFDCCPCLYSWCPCKSGAVTNKYYDVFVCYNKSSEKWIKNQLVPFFQTERPHDRYYLQHASDNPDKHGRFGSYTKDKMNKSAIILLVLSDAFIMKEWNNKAFRDYLRLLLTKPYRAKEERVKFLSIQLHDVSDEEVDDHIRSKLQLPKFTSLETDEFFFWKKLEYFLYLNHGNQVIMPVNTQQILSSDESTVIEETGVVNEQFLLDEYTTSLEQIVYEQPEPEVIQNIKYDNLNKKFTIKIGGERAGEPIENASMQEFDERRKERSSRGHHSKNSKRHHKTSHREEKGEIDGRDINLNHKILNESLKYYRSINRTPRQRSREESSENRSNSRNKTYKNDQNQIMKCADPKNMVMY